ncbi:MAG TPA: ABC transporter permease, partial [Thermoprotei archaeon]|nr:ABC transporter permease [Thermoprotei archaeon]
MKNILIIARKEIIDVLKSKRFIVLISLFVIFYIAGLSFIFTLTGETIGRRPLIFLFSNLLNTLGFIAPLIGVVIGFDAISGEREKGTLKILLSQPIYRDDIVNGKILAFITVISLSILAATGISIGAFASFLNISMDDVFRILLIAVFAILLSIGYYSISLFFSIHFRKTTHSALASISLWITLTLILPILASIIAFIIVGPPPQINPGMSGKPRQGFRILREYWNKYQLVVRTITFFSLNHHFDAVARKLLSTSIIIFGQSKRNITIIEALSQSYVNISVLI